MEAYRVIITGSNLTEVIDLPDRLRKSELEVIILPVVKEKRFVKGLTKGRRQNHGII